MSNNSTLNNSFEFDQVDFEALDSSDAMEALSPENASPSGETNEILAEMCFLEAEDLISRGDLSGAINSYKQACKYAPTKVNYSIKLIDLLLEDSASIKEAEELLNKNLTILPNNLELNIRLHKLKNKTSQLNSPIKKDFGKFLEQSDSTQKVFKDDIKAVAASMGVDLEKEAKKAGITDDAAAILREIDELENKSATSSLSIKKQSKENLPSGKFKALKPEEPLSLNTGKFKALKPEESSPSIDDTASILKELNRLETQSLTPLKTIDTSRTETKLESAKTTLLEKTPNTGKTKLLKSKIAKTEEKALANQLSRSKWLVLTLVFLIGAFGFAYELFSKPSIVLLNPEKQNISEVKDIKFEWTCNRKVAQFAIEVYEDEVFIIKQFTKETSYTPSAKELERFSPNHTYKWRIILPDGLDGDYTFATETKTFSVSNSIQVTPSSQPEENQEVIPPQTLTPPPVQDKRSNSVKKSHPDGEI
jgi:tetratricopeptide (TPR) repeat protein